MKNSLKIDIISFFDNFDTTKQVYIGIASFISTVLTYFTDIHTALVAFLLITLIDTFTRIHASAIKKGMKFEPWTIEFWKQIESKGLRRMCDKVFGQYSVYLILTFIIDVFILKSMIIVEMFNQGLTLPIIALYIFSAIEIWSIGENLEDAGLLNLPKRILHLFPEKYRKIINPEEEKTNEY